MSAQHTPGPWGVFSTFGRTRLRYVAKRVMPNGDAEYINSPNGFPRLFATPKAARAAIAKAGGAA